MNLMKALLDKDFANLTRYHNEGRTTFVRRSANLWQYKAMLQEKLAE